MEGALTMGRKLLDLLVICLTSVSFTATQALAVETVVLSERISSDFQFVEKKMSEILKNRFEAGIEAAKAIAFLKASFSSAQDNKYLDGLLKLHQIPENYVLKFKSVKFENNSIEVVSTNGRKVTFSKANGNSLKMNNMIIDDAQRNSAKTLIERIQLILRATYVADSNQNILFYLAFPEAHADAGMVTVGVGLLYAIPLAVAALAAIVLAGTAGAHYFPDRTQQALGTVREQALNLANKSLQTCELERINGPQYDQSESKKKFKEMEKSVSATGVGALDCEQFVGQKFFSNKDSGWQTIDDAVELARNTFTPEFCQLSRRYSRCMEEYNNPGLEKQFPDRPNCFTNSDGKGGESTYSFEKCHKCELRFEERKWGPDTMCARLVGTNQEDYKKMVGKPYIDCARRRGNNTWKGVGLNFYNGNPYNVHVEFKEDSAILTPSSIYGMYSNSIRLKKVDCSSFNTKTAAGERQTPAKKRLPARALQ
jgi:hypothetical protein